MVTKIQEIECKFSDKYKPRTIKGVTFSANVPTPAVDFSKIRPHLYRNLPKPEPFPVHGCSVALTIQNFTQSTRSNALMGGGKTTKFEVRNPFGTIPGFLTNLGIVPVPAIPTGGYIYSGGVGNHTSYCLFAEPVFNPPN